MASSYLISALLLLAGVEPSPAPSVRYTIDAAVDVEARLIKGTIDVETDVTGSQPLKELVFVVYGNRYRELLPGVTDINFVRVYPRKFKPAGAEIDAGDLKTAWTTTTLLRVVLSEPVAPGETARATLKFTTRMPEKFGTYGEWKGVLVANGGWHPTLVARDTESGKWLPDAQLPLARFEAKIRSPSNQHWIILHQRALKASELTETVDTRHLLLGVAEKLHEHVRGDFRILQAAHHKKHANKQLAIWAEARTWLEDVSDTSFEKPFTGLEMYLPRRLTVSESALPMVTYRMYRINPPLARYHDTFVARAYFAGALRDLVESREPQDAEWVLHGLSWELAEQFADERGRYKDPRRYIKNLGWIPAIDLVIYGERFPYAHQYYGNFYWSDPLRDDPHAFGHLRPNGHITFEKLRDLIGTEAVREIIAVYMKSPQENGGFRAIAQRVTGKDLTAFFERWRKPLPPVNYSVQEMTSRKKEDGYEVSLHLKREGENLDEPIQVLVDTKKGKEQFTWKADEESDWVTIETKAPPKTVVVDPGGRLLESVKWDNRMPREWKFVLQYFYVDYDFKIGEAAGAAGIEIQRTWDKRNELDTAIFWTQESLGAQVGYVRSFGRESWYRSLMHRVGLFLLVERLDTGFAKDGLNVIPGFDPLRSEVDASVGLLLSYRYDDRIDFRWPRSGNRFSIALEGGIGLPNRTSPYFRWSATGTRLQKLTDNHVLAFRARAGSFIFTSVKGIPLPKLFFIGGISDMRGLSEPEVVGPSRFLLSTEWRWFAIRNIDINLWLVRIRGFQPVLFADTGYVSRSGSVVPVANDWFTDVGFALRTHFDALGVRPMLLRWDFAQRIDPCFTGPCKADVRFYMGLGQSF